MWFAVPAVVLAHEYAIALHAILGFHDQAGEGRRGVGICTITPTLKSMHTIFGAEQIRMCFNCFVEVL
jgi:hypothetical protein